MTDTTEKKPEEALDTSDLDRWIGRPVGRGQLVDPVHVGDIKRWVQAMHYPNKLHYDAGYAAESRYGQIVAPQSFAVACDTGHGARPALVGNIPNSHMLFGGDEWWFFGPRILPCDHLTVDQVSFDYRHTSTRFAGPTVIQRGDSHYTNQRGEKVALQRSSAVRYRPSEARDTGAFEGQEDDAELSADELEKVAQETVAYIQTIHDLGHDRRLFSDVTVGDALPTKVIGPHSVVSFATEWRAYMMNTWGMRDVELFEDYDSGWTEEMAQKTEEDVEFNPELGDGAYYGASRGHLFQRYAHRVGMPRPYGYGASMGAWILDYLSAWVGEWGHVWHTNSQYRFPALTGDVTYLRGNITGKEESSHEPNMGTVSVEYAMTNQRGDVMSKGFAELLLPRS